jgi:hypothetical protein
MPANMMAIAGMARSYMANFLATFGKLSLTPLSMKKG